jgi:hypothetical protein
MDQEPLPDRTLLMAAVSSATAQIALQVWQTRPQTGKGPVALHQQAQGLHRKRGHRPATDRVLACTGGFQG